MLLTEPRGPRARGSIKCQSTTDELMGPIKGLSSYCCTPRTIALLFKRLLHLAVEMKLPASFEALIAEQERVDEVQRR